MNFKNPRIVAASAIGLIMVVGAFALSQGQALVAENQPAQLTKVRQFIAVNDSDNNRVPDWQEPFATSQVDLGDASNTAAYELEGETGKFIATLAGGFVQAKAATDQIFSPLELLKSTNETLRAELLDLQYTEADITVTDDNSEAALRRYGNKVAEIAMQNSASPESKDEMTILYDALKKGEDDVLVELDPTIRAYEDMTAAMLSTPVPSSLIREHLSLINVYQALAVDIKSFRNVLTDALPAMVRLRRYPSDAGALYTAISNLYLKLNEVGIQWSESDTASRFISIEIR